jgi:hypothetical protein
MAAPVLTWPLTVEDLAKDMYGEENSDPSLWDAEQLQMVLDAAVAWVRPKWPRINWDGAVTIPPLPDPGQDLMLGILRLAARWHNRRSSPNGLVDMGEMGGSRITTYDPDIDRMLRLGRWSKAVIG